MTKSSDDGFIQSGRPKTKRYEQTMFPPVRKRAKGTCSVIEKREQRKPAIIGKKTDSGTERKREGILRQKTLMQFGAVKVDFLRDSDNGDEEEEEERRLEEEGKDKTGDRRKTPIMKKIKMEEGTMDAGIPDISGDPEMRTNTEKDGSVVRTMDLRTMMERKVTDVVGDSEDEGDDESPVANEFFGIHKQQCPIASTQTRSPTRSPSKGWQKKTQQQSPFSTPSKQRIFEIPSSQPSPFTPMSSRFHVPGQAISPLLLGSHRRRNTMLELQQQGTPSKKKYPVSMIIGDSFTMAGIEKSEGNRSSSVRQLFVVKTEEKKEAQKEEDIETVGWSDEKEGQVQGQLHGPDLLMVIPDSDDENGDEKDINEEIIEESSILGYSEGINLEDPPSIKFGASSAILEKHAEVEVGRTPSRPTNHVINNSEDDDDDANEENMPLEHEENDKKVQGSPPDSPLYEIISDPDDTIIPISLVHISLLSIPTQPPSQGQIPDSMPSPAAMKETATQYDVGAETQAVFNMLTAGASEAGESSPQVGSSSIIPVLESTTPQKTKKRAIFAKDPEYMPTKYYTPTLSSLQDRDPVTVRKKAPLRGILRQSQIATQTQTQTQIDILRLSQTQQLETQFEESQRVPLEVIQAMRPPTNRTDVFISIYPEHINDIITGSKNYEFRNYQIHHEVVRLWLYVTKPISELQYMAVIGPAKTPEELQGISGVGNMNFCIGRSGRSARRWAYELKEVYALNDFVGLAEMKIRGWLEAVPQRYTFLAPGVAAQLLANLQKRLIPFKDSLESYDLPVLSSPEALSRSPDGIVASTIREPDPESMGISEVRISSPAALLPSARFLIMRSVLDGANVFRRREKGKKREKGKEKGRERDGGVNGNWRVKKGSIPSGKAFEQETEIKSESTHGKRKDLQERLRQTSSSKISAQDLLPPFSQRSSSGSSFRSRSQSQSRTTTTATKTTVSAYNPLETQELEALRPPAPLPSSQEEISLTCYGQRGFPESPDPSSSHGVKLGLSGLGLTQLFRGGLLTQGLMEEEGEKTIVVVEDSEE